MSGSRADFDAEALAAETAGSTAEDTEATTDSTDEGADTTTGSTQEESGETTPETIEVLRYSVTVEPATLTIMFLAGQSNMEGYLTNNTVKNYNHTYVVPCEPGTVYSSYGAKRTYNAINIAGTSKTVLSGSASNAANLLPGSLTSDTTASLSGGTLSYPLNGLTSDCSCRKTGMDAGLAYRWNELTGEKVWVINAAVGGTAIDRWDPESTTASTSGKLYYRAQKFYLQALQVYNAEIEAGHFKAGHRLMFWLQGEWDWDTLTVNVCLTTPKLSVANVSAGVTVKWGKVAGAAKYRVLRKTSSGKWVKVGDTTGTSYTDKSAKSGTTYTYTVRCISSDGKSYTSNYNATGKTICRLSSVTLSSAKNVKGKKMKISWKKNTSGTGYQIQYSTDKRFRTGVTTKTISKNKTTSATFSKLTKKKTYYVRIRSYKIVSGTTYYSAWSGSKSVKIKK